jgi:hypothetical protein
MKKIVTMFFAMILLVLIANFVSAQSDVSLGAATGAPVLAPWTGDGPDFAGSRAFVYNGAGPFQLNKQSLANTNLTPIGSTVTFGFPAAATVRTSDNVLFVVDQAAPFTLYTVDTTTGVRTTVANCTGVTFSNLTGITWDPAHSIMYGVYSNLSTSGIFSVNLTTGVCTPIGTASATCAGGISISSSRTGTLFVVDIVGDNLYKVNRTTGVFTLVGPLGVTANYGQDAQFDMNPGSGLGDNVLYWAGCGWSGVGSELRRLDTTNASSTVIGGYPAQATTLGIFGKSVGVKEVKNVNINVYPNPANTVVNIEANNIQTYKVMNVAGQVISEVVVNNNNAQIDVSNYDAGVYVVQVKTNSGLITKKITVTK